MAGHRKPTAVRELEGNRGHRPLPQNEPIPPEGELVCPDWLSKYAKEEWQRLIGALTAMNVAKPIDTTAFAAYCQCYANWREAEEMMIAHGATTLSVKGELIASPYSAIALKNLDAMKKFMTAFGLTPESRSRIIAGGADVVEDTADTMEQLLRIV